MAGSQFLQDLRRAIVGLRNQFLPPVFDPLGNYANAVHVQAHARAFVVLSHAELEYYLESWAKAIARKAEVVWASSSRVSKPLVFLMATLANRMSHQTTGTGKDGPAQLAMMAPQVFQKFYKLIKDNNGVKEKNCIGLFGPLGVPVNAYGATLLPGLDSFGVLRGTHAHQSSKGILTPLDPETEYLAVMGLLVELQAFDDWLSAYKRAIR